MSRSTLRAFPVGHHAPNLLRVSLLGLAISGSGLVLAASDERFESGTETPHAAVGGNACCLPMGGCMNVATSVDCNALGGLFEPGFPCGFDDDGDGCDLCVDECPNDPEKCSAGICGCGIAESDVDGDGAPDCVDGCPSNPEMTFPNHCGCNSENEFVAYLADSPSPFFTPLDLDERFADDIEPITDLCNLVHYDVDHSGADGAYIIDLEIWSDDELHNHALAPVLGTAQSCNGPGDVTIATCSFDPPAPVFVPTPRLWMTYDVDGHRAGPVLTNSFPGIGFSEDAFAIFGNPTSGQWSEPIWFFGGCPPGGTAPCGTFVTQISCSCDYVVGACCLPNSACLDSMTLEDCNTSNGVFVANESCDGDVDGDGVDGVCGDQCPEDPLKIAPGACECGVPNTDTDNDGKSDCIDNCDTTPNPSQQDSDVDGVGNACDGCPFDSLKVAPGICGCGIIEDIGDEDGDGCVDCNDACPSDPNKCAPGICGCAVADTDTDGDGTPDCIDACPNDPNKVSPDLCGCGVPDTDSDGDGAPDCDIDMCPFDPGKIAPGVCGCGTPDTDSDGDGTPDCIDECDNDPNKVTPGVCGCGVPEIGDLDGDGCAECVDGCPGDSNKCFPGICGCDVPDTDADMDGVPACLDDCELDPQKVTPGPCGCGVPDIDSDMDGAVDCVEDCDNDPNKFVPGACGCGVPDADTDIDTIPDCNDLCPGDDDTIDADNNGEPDCLTTGGPIPTASTWGLIAMTLLLLSGARVLFRSVIQPEQTP